MSNEMKDWIRENQYEAVLDYERICKETALYPNADKDLTYPIMGLAGETGELCNKYKKFLRGDFTEDELKEFAENLADEVGDILWYLTRISNTLGFSLADIMRINSTKLIDRKERGVIKGSGDKR